MYMILVPWSRMKIEFVNVEKRVFIKVSMIVVMVINICHNSKKKKKKKKKNLSVEFVL